MTAADYRVSDAPSPRALTFRRLDAELDYRVVHNDCSQKCEQFASGKAAFTNHFIRTSNPETDPLMAPSPLESSDQSNKIPCTTVVRRRNTVKQCTTDLAF
jgi:hypothetical protein